MRILILALLFVVQFPDYSVAQFTLPYSEDFENGSPGWTTTSVNPLTNWELGTPSFGTSGSTHSGIFCWDINLLTAAGNNANSTLESPVFIFDSSAYVTLSFWQNFNNSTCAGMRIEYTTDQINWQQLGNNDTNGVNWYNGYVDCPNQDSGWTNSSNGYIFSSYNIYGLTNQQVAFRFIYTTWFSGNNEGISFDDFSLIPRPLTDLSVTNVSVISSGLLGSTTDSVAVTVFNSGSASCNNFTVSYNYDIITSSLVIPNMLAPGDSINVRLPGFIISEGSLCGSVNVAGDTIQSNDVLCPGYGVFSAVNYFNDFDSTIAGWHSYTPGIHTTNWEWGMPTYGTAATKCWGTNLLSTYKDDAFTILESPVFDLTGAVSPIINLKVWMDTENGWDGVKLQYMHNNNGTWISLGDYNDGFGYNWYNYGTLYSIQYPNQPGWSGLYSAWQSGRYNLPATISIGTLKFRFIFESDPSINGTGFLIEDFGISSGPAIDVALTGILSPAEMVYFNNRQLTVTLRNDCAQNLTSIPVNYVLNGLLSSTTWNGLLQSDSTVLFSPGILQLNPGLNTLTVYTNLTNDGFTGNDTIFMNIYYELPVAVPYANSFDSINEWQNLPYMGLSEWQWGTPSYGATNSAFSAPYCYDIDLSTGYNEYSGAYLQSPIFNISGNTGVDIHFNMNFNTQPNADGAELLYSLDNINWQTLGIINDPAGKNWYNGPLTFSTAGWSGNSGGWQQMSYTENSFTNDSIIIFRFNFRSDSLNNSDGVSVDDFRIDYLHDNDAAILSILSPPPVFSATTPQTVSIELKNIGTQLLTNLQLYYDIDNIPVGNLSWSGSLIKDSSTIVSFPAQTFTSGPHQLKVYLAWPLDTFPLNDTIEMHIDATSPYQLPYYNNFDNGQGDYYVTNSRQVGTAWEHGIPSFNTTATSHTTPYCWDINLQNGYMNQARTYLVTPPFDFSNHNVVNVSFWLNYFTETASDGMYVEYTTDDINWNSLGLPNDSMGINWYPGVIYNGRPAWSGNSAGWIQVALNSVQLNNLPYCRLRFGFESNNNFTLDGLSIDDLSLSAITGIDENSGLFFRVYPNPANEIIYLAQLPVGKNRIEILDATGRMISQENNVIDNTSVSCKNLAPETYILKVLSEKGEVGFRKFIKQ